MTKLFLIPGVPECGAWQLFLVPGVPRCDAWPSCSLFMGFFDAVYGSAVIFIFTTVILKVLKVIYVRMDQQLFRIFLDLLDVMSGQLFIFSLF